MVLLINIPSRRGAGGHLLPLGLLYAASISERCGHTAKILDPYLDDPQLKDFDSDNFENIYKAIEDHRPSIIGYGGISTSYDRTKRISRHIAERYPSILQIAGGVLSSVSDLLLTRAEIDIVFHGETEISLPVFLEKHGKGEPVYDTPGISYVSDNNNIVTTPMPEQIKDMDDIPFPAYHLLDIDRYLRPIHGWLDVYKRLFNDNPNMPSVVNKIGDKRHYILLSTARGCTESCSFCYRHMRGIRQHSAKYVIDHIKHLKNNYGIEGFRFADELFNSDPEWMLRFCDLIEKESLDIFYIIGGARIDTMSAHVLQRLKDTGCVEINYGQESGSDVILKEYGKGVWAQQNKEITLSTKKLGMSCPVQIVIGSPSETSNTIRETIRFLVSVGAYPCYIVNYLIPLPRTPIWHYARRRGLIGDTEEYLKLVAEREGAPLVNLTQAPDDVWKNWGRRIKRELRLHHYREKAIALIKRIPQYMRNMLKLSKLDNKRSPAP